MSLLLTLALSSTLKLGKHKAGSLAGHQEHICTSPDLTRGKEKHVKGFFEGDDEGPREYWGDFPVPLGSGQLVNLVGRIGRLDPKGVALSFVNDNVKRLLWVPEKKIKSTGSTLHLQLFSFPYPRDQKRKEHGKADTE